MKTLQIIGDSKFGGATHLLIEWCSFLIKRGWDVSVLTTDEKTKSAISPTGVKIIDSIYIPRDISIKHDYAALRKLINLLYAEQFDVVHTYSATPSVLGRFAAKCVGVKKVFHHQAAWTVFETNNPFKQALYKLVEYFAVWCSTECICVSNAVFDQAWRYKLAPANKLICICNGINTQPFRSSEKTITNWQNKLIVGSTGRLSELKDIASIIKAIEIIIKAEPNLDVHLYLAGEGSERKRLEDLAINLGINNRIHFIGFTKDVAKFLKDVDVFVSASLREGLSISILEAMAAKKPIIATRILPNCELIQDEVTGLLVDVQSPDQIAAALWRLINNTDLALRCATLAREKVNEKYTIDRMFSETYGLYIE